MIDRPNSMLPLVVFDAATTWADLLKIPGILLDVDGLQRLQHALDATAKSMAVERHYIDKDYRDTFSTFHSKKFSTPVSRCDRLHFFNVALNRVELADQGKLQASYIGYSIVRPTRPNSIARTLLDPARLSYPQGWLRLCDEQICLQGVDLSVSGFPFISQDADVTVCAQSALWMLLRFFSNRYPNYREIYPSEIGLLVKDFSLGRIFPSSGLTDWQMAECLRQLGFAPLIYSRPTDSKGLFDFLLYTYIESGFPVLISFKDHVVVAYGHESDFAKPLPAGMEDVTTAHFNKAYVISDDNSMPYELLTDASSATPHASQKYRLADIESFTVPLPTRVHLPAEDFFGLVNDLLANSIFGRDQQSSALKGQQLILRLFLTTCRSFKSHLSGRNMGHSTAFNLYQQLPLPHFIWVCELSTATAFGIQHVLGEVIWDATRNAHEPNGWIALHYPEKLIVDAGSALNGPPNIKEFPLPGATDYPLYRHNLQRIR